MTNDLTKRLGVSGSLTRRGRIRNFAGVLDGSPGLSEETRGVLLLAHQRLQQLPISDGYRQVLAANLLYLTGELNQTGKSAAWRVAIFWRRIRNHAPELTAILSTAAEIRGLVGL